jgi:hypothetical protein
MRLAETLDWKGLISQTMQHKTITKSEKRTFMGDTDVVEFTGHFFFANCQLVL